MSSETSPSSVRTSAPIDTGLSDQFRRLTAGGVRAIAFWAAVLLPLAYVPAAYEISGFETAGSTLALLVFHTACIVVGHGHNTSSEAVDS